MKIYNKLVIDMTSMEVLEEDSFEYEGPLALCGGGGSSGEIVYPEYMMGVHGGWLADDTFAPSVNYWMRSCFNQSPFDDAAYLPYDPDARLTNMDTKWQYYYTMVDELVNDNPLAVGSPSERLISAYTAKQNTEMNTVVLPRFNAGMLDINAVQSSAFVLGHALIEMRNTATIAEFAANILNNNENSKREHVKALSHMGVEVERLGIIAKAEYQTKRADQAAMDRLWELEVFKYGCNVMACIGSASVHTGQKSVSPGASALGGALSGGAAGAMTGAQIGSGYPGIGTAIGAVVGGIAGYLMA